MTLYPNYGASSFAPRQHIAERENRLILDGLKQGAGYQLVYAGIIFYKDAFGDRHYTRYCWMFTGESMAAKDAEACLGHNDSN